MGPELLPESPPNQSRDLVNQAFEGALRGNAEALKVLLSLLKTRYGKGIFKALRHHRGYAQTATMEDIFQQSIVDFIQEIESRALRELPESERRNIVQFFQRMCDRKLENLRRPRRTALYSQKKNAIHVDIIEDKRNPRTQVIPGAERRTEAHLELLNKHIGQLDDFDRLVLERYLEGVPYSEIAKETGKKIPTLESLVSRIKRRLADAIAEESPTARLNLERTEEPAPTRSCLPTRDEVLSAIEDLPLETQKAIEFVHVKGGSVEDLAKSLGERGREKAEVRLKRGYESLSLLLDLPFPDSFEVLGS